MSSKKAARLAKAIGIEGAAVALGIGTVELAQMVLDSSTSSRRGRGISAAQMRTTRRTIRSVTGLYRQIQSACGGAGMARRASRRAPPFALAKAKCR